MTKQEQQTIAAEVRAVIRDLLAQDITIGARWIVDRVIDRWETPSGKDADKWLICGYANVRAVVRKVLHDEQRPSEDDNQDDPQLALPGYTKLKRGYLVPRDGEQTLVPIGQLTIDDAQWILVELTRTESGIRLHKAELEAYLAEHIIPRCAAR